MPLPTSGTRNNLPVCVRYAISRSGQYTARSGPTSGPICPVKYGPGLWLNRDCNYAQHLAREGYSTPSGWLLGAPEPVLLGRSGAELVEVGRELENFEVQPRLGSRVHLRQAPDVDVRSKLVRRPRLVSGAGVRQAPLQMMTSGPNS